MNRRLKAMKLARPVNDTVHVNAGEHRVLPANTLVALEAASREFGPIARSFILGRVN